MDSVNAHPWAQKMWCVTQWNAVPSQKEGSPATAWCGRSPAGRMRRAASSHGRTPAAAPPPERRRHTRREPSRVGGRQGAREVGDGGGGGWEAGGADQGMGFNPAPCKCLLRGQTSCAVFVPQQFQSRVGPRGREQDAGVVGQEVAPSLAAWVWLGLSSQRHGIPESLRNRMTRFASHFKS